MKILHLPTSVGGNSWGLAQGEKLLGLDSKVLVESANLFKYPFDMNMDLNKHNLLDYFYKKLKTFIDVRKRFDIFHFNFGRTLIDVQGYHIDMWDLPFYKGKKIMTYNGTDARQNLNVLKGKYIGEIYEIQPYNNIKRNLNIQKRINKVFQNVDHIFSLNPDLMYFLPKKITTFLPYTIAGWKNIKDESYKIIDKINIVHAPTNRSYKGSDYILKALSKLQKKYSNIEINLIENLPYSEALKKYREAHIIIDQVLIGWYGAFGVETMKMGKPLAVFIREEDLQFIPSEMAKDLMETIININPSNIEEVLENCILNTNILYTKSQLSLNYVHKWHNPLYVADITKSIYES